MIMIIVILLKLNKIGEFQQLYLMLKRVRLNFYKMFWMK